MQSNEVKRRKKSSQQRTQEELRKTPAGNFQLFTIYPCSFFSIHSTMDKGRWKIFSFLLMNYANYSKLSSSPTCPWRANIKHRASVTYGMWRVVCSASLCSTERYLFDLKNRRLICAVHSVTESTVTERRRFCDATRELCHLSSAHSTSKIDEDCFACSAVGSMSKFLPANFPTPENTKS